MNFLQYSLTALFSYLGLVIGLIVMKTSKEEQKAGKKYFIFMQNIILLLIIIFLLYFFKLNLIVSSVVLLIVIIVMVKSYGNLKQSYNIFPLLGIIFYLSSDNPKFMLVESSLIFLYGLVSSSLLINFKKKNYLEIMLKHATFLIIALLMFIFSSIS